jgi:hypothetical protein
MRKAINENRTVQLVLVGVLVLAAGLFLLHSKGSGSGSSTTTAASPTGTATAPTAAAPTATGTTGTASTDPTTGAPVTDSSTSSPVLSGASAAAVPANLVPGPGLPKSLLPAYNNGKAIVLLVRRAGGTDDALVHSSVDLLAGLPDVKVYVTRAQHIARYAWLTQGVDVTELPALVVLRPRKLTKGTPTASVSYGFRGSDSVVQAVKDALYRGPSHRPYHP